MRSKGTKVTPKEIEKMVALYEELQSYKLVGRRLRRSPDTVSKYVNLHNTIKQVGNYYDNIINMDNK